MIGFQLSLSRVTRIIQWLYYALPRPAKVPIEGAVCSIIQVISRVVVPDVVLLSQTSASGKLVTVKTKVNNSDEEARNEFHEMASITNNPVDDRRNKVIISIIDNHDNEMPP